MIENNKTYGFTIAVKELRETVPNIWRYASAYKRLNNLTSKGLWEMFVESKPEPEEVPEAPESPPLPEEILRSDPGRNTLPDIDPETMEGESYNMCHFWSNFEIARLSFFRSKEYEDFFEMMDRSGGFWMERVSGSCSKPIHHNAIVTCATNTNYGRSGAMRLFTPSPLALYSLLMISTISETLDIDTLRSNIAQQMPPWVDSFLGNHIWRRQRPMRGRDTRKTITGSTGTLPRRTVWAAVAAATPISLTSRAKKAAAWLNGLKLLVDGPAHRVFHIGKKAIGVRTKKSYAHLGSGSRRKWKRRRSCSGGLKLGLMGWKGPWRNPRISALRFMSDICLFDRIFPVTIESQSSSDNDDCSRKTTTATTTMTTTTTTTTTTTYLSCLSGGFWRWRFATVVLLVSPPNQCNRRLRNHPSSAFCFA